MAAQLADTLLAPGQVIDFLIGGMLHGAAHVRQLGGQRLTLVQRLGAYFARVVDAHQAGDMPRGRLIQFALGLHDGRRGAAGLATEGQQGTQRRVCLQEQAVYGGVVTFAGHRAPPAKREWQVYSNRRVTA
ncbi:hypothetical protein D3C84_651500 [compost metagenome]